MPYEDTLPLLAVFLVMTTLFLWLWRSSGQYQWAVIAFIMFGAGCGVVGIDWLFETDREKIEILLPSLARAVERKDLEVLFNVIAPEMQPVRELAEKAVHDVMPKQVLITRLEIEMQPGHVFPMAVANMLVRITGRIDESSLETVIVSVVVTLQKRDRWLVTGCLVESPDIMNKKKTTRAGQVIR